MKTISFLITLFIINALSFAQDVKNDPELRDLYNIIQTGSEQQRYVMLEELLFIADSLHEFYILPYASKLAFNTGHYEAAEEHSIRLLELALVFRDNWNYGNAVNVGYMILGRIAVKNNELEVANTLLINSAKTPGSRQLNDFGPNLSLAKDLLQKQQYDTVIEYLELCKDFWRTGGPRIDKWIKEIKASQTPNFGGNLYY